MFHLRMVSKVHSFRFLHLAENIRVEKAEMLLINFELHRVSEKCFLIDNYLQNQKVTVNQEFNPERVTD